LTVRTRRELPLDHLDTQKALASAYATRQRGEPIENQKAIAAAELDAMETVDDLIGDGLAPQQVQDLMTRAGDL
jgi:hypothetical protein